MRLVDENSERELAEHRARADIRWPLRELASNIMRVVRGAGKGYAIGQQCIDVIKAFQDYHDAVGHYPTDYEISEAISLRFGDEEGRKHWDDMSYATHEVMEGSLQYAASELLGQATQRAAGRSQMFDGIAKIEKIREANRRKWQTSARKGRPKTAPNPWDQE